jgi:hypothetical protein
MHEVVHVAAMHFALCSCSVSAAGVALLADHPRSGFTQLVLRAHVAREYILIRDQSEYINLKVERLGVEQKIAQHIICHTHNAKTKTRFGHICESISVFVSSSSAS